MEGDLPDKNKLQERCQQEGWAFPKYKYAQDLNAGINARWSSTCTVNDHLHTSGTGRTKADASNLAAAEMLRLLLSNKEGGGGGPKDNMLIFDFVTLNVADLSTVIGAGNRRIDIFYPKDLAPLTDINWLNPTAVHYIRRDDISIAIAAHVGRFLSTTKFQKIVIYTKDITIARLPQALQDINHKGVNVIVNFK